jgi:hypothetical protein
MVGLWAVIWVTCGESVVNAGACMKLRIWLGGGQVLIGTQKGIYRCLPVDRGAQLRLSYVHEG